MNQNPAKGGSITTENVDPIKQKNDFGKELGKHLSKKNYTSTRIREEAAAVDKEFDAAFAKVMAAKNPSGETYQSRVDAGKLPGSVNEK